MFVNVWLSFCCCWWLFVCFFVVFFLGGEELASSIPKPFLKFFLLALWRSPFLKQTLLLSNFVYFFELRKVQ